MSLIFIGTLTLSSCKKDEESETKNACADKNFCFKIGDSLSYSFDAKWISQAQSKYKVLFSQSLGGTSNEIAELEFKSDGGIRTGEFTFASVAASDGQAYFRYIKNMTGEITSFTCTEGKVTITKFEGNKITANFTCTGKDKDNKTVSITNGNVVEVSN